jgi:CubicO group peptidase (beta-lactamase class C family)
MQKMHIPGLSLAVVKNGEVIKAAGCGSANLETETPAVPETVYKTASLSKQVIAAAIMLLAQDGKVSLMTRSTSTSIILPRHGAT